MRWKFWKRGEDKIEPPAVNIEKILNEIKETIKDKHRMEAIIRLKQQKNVLVENEGKRSKFLENIASKGHAFLFDEKKTFGEIVEEMGELAAVDRELMREMEKLMTLEKDFFNKLKSWKESLEKYRIDISHEVFRFNNLLKFEESSIINILQELHKDEKKGQTTEETLRKLLKNREKLITKRYDEFEEDEAKLQEENERETKLINGFEDKIGLKQKIWLQIKWLEELYQKIAKRLHTAGIAIGEDEKKLAQVGAEASGLARRTQQEEQRNLFIRELISLIEREEFGRAREYVEIGSQRGLINQNIQSFALRVIGLIEGGAGQEIINHTIELRYVETVYPILNGVETGRLRTTVTRLISWREWNQRAKDPNVRRAGSKPEITLEVCVFLDEFFEKLANGEITASEQVWEDIAKQPKYAYYSATEEGNAPRNLAEEKDRSILTPEDLRRVNLSEMIWRDILQQQIFAYIMRLLNSTFAKTVLSEEELRRLSLVVEHLRAKHLSASHKPEIKLQTYIFIDELISKVESEEVDNT